MLSPEQAVSQRAQERWDHLIAGRTEQAWQFLSPGARSVLDRDSYATSMRSRPVRWVGAEVVGLRCDNAASCELDVMVKTLAPLPFAGAVPGQSTVTERWVLLEQTWYHLPADFR